MVGKSGPDLDAEIEAKFASKARRKGDLTDELNELLVSLGGSSFIICFY